MYYLFVFFAMQSYVKIVNMPNYRPHFSEIIEKMRPGMDKNVQRSEHIGKRAAHVVDSIEFFPCEELHLYGFGGFIL